MAGTTGLEPATSAVTGQRSNQTELRPQIARPGNPDLNVTEISDFCVSRKADWISLPVRSKTKVSEQHRHCRLVYQKQKLATAVCGGGSLENMAVLADIEWIDFHNYTSLPLRLVWHKRAIPARTRLNLTLVKATNPLERPCWIGPNYPIWRQSHC